MFGKENFYPKGEGFLKNANTGMVISDVYS